LLNRVIARVHAAAQESRSRTEFELGSITIRLLALLRQGREANLDVACSEAFGMHFAKWRQKSLERSSALAWEFQQLIPDFDPAEAKHAAMVKASGVRRPEAFSGNLYEMPQEEIAAESQPVRRLSGKATERQSKTAG
jgi:hypothetical protein